MYTLDIDDYFSAEEINIILHTMGYDLISRSWTVVSTRVVIEDVEGDYDVDTVAAVLQEELFATVRVQ